MKRRLSILMICSLTFLLATSAWAGRPDKNWKSWFGHFGGGYVSVLGSSIGEAGSVIDNGWNLNGGATYWPETWPVGIDLELAYNDLGVKSEALAGLDGVDSADFTIWSVTADAMWGPKPGGTVNVYLMGGVGVYRSRATLGEDAVFNGIICSPWWPWCAPGLIPGTRILFDESQTKFGYNFGAGITFEVGLGSQIYLEAKWHRAETDPVEIEYIPIVLGYRW